MAIPITQVNAKVDVRRNSVRVVSCLPVPDDWKTLTYTIAGYEHTTGEALVVAKDILVIPNALPFLMTQLILSVEGLDVWSAPTVVRGNETRHDYEFRDCKKANVRGDAHESLAPFQAVMSILEMLFALAYKLKVNRHMDISKGAGWELLRYGPGQFFKEHIDAIMGNDSGIANRQMTMVALHSTGCVGGELVFPRQGVSIHPNGEVKVDGEVVLLPAPGTLVVHPSGPVFPHEATIVEEGFKYTLAGFFA